MRRQGVITDRRFELPPIRAQRDVATSSGGHFTIHHNPCANTGEDVAMDTLTTDTLTMAITLICDGMHGSLPARGRQLDGCVRDVMREIGRGVVRELLRREAERLVAEGKTRGLVTQRAQQVTFYSIFGAVEVRSPYMWSAVDQQGWRPLKEEFGVVHRGRSDLVERALTDFGSDRSFEQAARAFHEHHGWQIGRTTVRSVTQRHARAAETFVDRTLADEAQAYMAPCATRPGRDHIVVQLDGCAIRTGEVMSARRAARFDLPPDKKVRQEQWREVRTGLARDLGEVDPTYVCRLDSYDGVTEHLFGAACAHGLSERSTVIAPSDGAHGLREALEERFPRLRFVLDYPHLKSHIYDTATELGMDDGVRERWCQTMLDRIWHGEASAVLVDLRALHASGGNERLRRFVEYLERFEDAVDYQQLVDAGWPIGSGEVESAHRYIPQARLKIPGACWAVDNVNPMLALRLLKANGWWDEYWANDEDHQSAA